MAEQAIVRYQVVIAGEEMVVEEKVEVGEAFSIHSSDTVKGFVFIGGDLKRMYVHKDNLVAVIVEKVSDTE